MRLEAKDLRVRPMSAADIEFVVEIAKMLPEAPQWAHAVYRKTIEPNQTPARIALVAEVAAMQTIVGFAIAQLISPDAELESIAVTRNAQGCGVGRRIFLELVERLRQERVTVVNLEVRASNAKAIGFYDGRGFRESGRRPRYYSHPEEDAVLMSLDLADIRAEQVAEKGKICGTLRKNSLGG